MGRRFLMVCILGILLGLLAIVVVWSADDQEQNAKPEGKKTEVSREQPKQTAKETATDKRDDPWPGKERVKGWSTTVVVVPPPYTYNPYQRYHGYAPGYYYPYNSYYPTNPWGYKGPPIISGGGAYDSALIWNQQRQGFSWDPISPQRPGSRIPGPVVNPNFVRRPANSNYSEPQASQSDATRTYEKQAQEPRELGSWEKRGLVSSVDREAKSLTVITPKGLFIVDTRDAVIVKSGYRATLANISTGDAVRIWAELIGLNTVAADRVEVSGATNGEEAGAALQPVRTRGKIVKIDYPSFTFTIRTDNGDIRVLASEDTLLSSPDNEREAFMNLKLGQTVKVVAIGSLTTGYAANEVVIVNE